MPPATDILDKFTREAVLSQSLPGKAIRCLACAHLCLIKEGRRGICKVRFNEDGKLMVPWGYVAGLQSDPVEKKPFYHLLPGSDALTFGMLGCDFHCSYCQNWQTSQVGRDSASDSTAGYIQPVSPEQLVKIARQTGSQVVASSYNEPLITSEWSAAIFDEAQKAGLKCVYISNGNATREALEFLRPYLVGYKVDLKTMNDRKYRQLGGVLQNVLTTIRMAYEMGLWVEVVTLVVPGYNDSPDELMEAAGYIASVSRDIPWHVTAFHPDYKMTDPGATSVEVLLRAAEIGIEAGLNFVYAGNIPSRLNPYENTICPQCHSVLIERSGFSLLRYQITSEGNCPHCNTSIPGIWTEKPSDVKTGGFAFPRPVIWRP
jgi:pyruvate formate lyase activating enzyme